jgi:hypothetical protein
MELKLTCEGTEDLIQHHVVRSNPCNEGKVAQSRKDVAGYPAPEKHPSKAEHKPTVSGDCPSGNRWFFVTMKCVE